MGFELSLSVSIVSLIFDIAIIDLGDMIRFVTMILLSYQSY